MKDAVIVDGAGIRHGKIDNEKHTIVERGERIPVKPTTTIKRPARVIPQRKPTPPPPQGNILGHVAKTQTVESGRNSKVLKK